MFQLEFKRQELLSQFGEACQVVEVIEQVHKESADKELVVLKVMINGVEWEEGSDAILSMALRDLEHIQFHLQPLSALITETLNSLVEWIPKVQGLILRSATKLRFGNVLERSQSLDQILQSYQWAVDALALLQIQFSKRGLAVSLLERWNELASRLHGVLASMLDRQQANDAIGIADCVEFELNELLSEFLVEIQKVKNQLDAE